jgi:hypothetical protein
MSESNILPASRTEKFNGWTIRVTFNVETQQWDWVATKPVTTSYHHEGTAKTIGSAFGAARRKINNVT